MTPAQTARLYAAVFSTENGKAVLEDLERVFGGQTFHASPHVAAFKAGRRDVTLHIRRLIALARSPRAPKEPNGAE